MRNLVSTVVSVVFVIVSAAPSSAAENQENQAQPNRRPPPEVGVGVERFYPIVNDWVTDSIHEPSLNLRATLPFTPRFAFEAIGTMGRRNDEFIRRTEGLYVLQIKQRLRRDTLQSFQPFITYGLTGYYARVEVRDYAIRQPDGSFKTYSGFKYTETDEPMASAFGVGFQQRLARHVALRADAQLLTFFWVPLGFRFSTGVSIPLGRYSTN